MKRKLTAALLGVLAMVSATVTNAQLPPGPHFTFTVPLQLANLPPEISRYAISCSVGAGSDLTMATGTTIAAISRGAVHADVAVNVTVTTARNPFAHPANATNYACELLLDNGNDVTNLRYLLLGTANFPLAPGAPYRSLLRGTIPR